MTSLPDPSQPLTRDEAAQAFSAILDGGAADDDVARFLLALSERGETALEIAAAARELRARMIPISAPANAIDVCGTGGDGHHTLNVSTAVSIVIAKSAEHPSELQSLKRTWHAAFCLQKKHIPPHLLSYKICTNILHQ